MNLRGLGVALVTPFKADKEIDFPALGRIIEHILTGKADYLVVLGTTGETPTLTADEKRKVREYVAEKVNGAVPLVTGMGGNCTQFLIEELKTTDLSGYSAILSVTPFYNKPGQDGIYHHFRMVAENSPLPVVLYNVPGRTSVNISAATTLRIADEFSNVIAIKEASGNFKQIEEIINSKRADFQVISGDDSLTYPLISLGAEGVISVVGNAFPKEFGEMTRLCLNGDFKKALPIHYKFSRLYDELFVDGNPAGVKSLLHSMGLLENELRLPLVPTRLSTSDELRSILEEWM
ncbi:MAG: 4-hydroxy-tetrahydrodipicolinate synthase [Candidatus Amulumruptor caecigallinarius]|nr:4-hydroxy-tetrahydrodipicolinate synthase [Candidatus Amulumruptor caecigallinarius]